MLEKICDKPIHLAEAFDDEGQVELFADEAAAVAKAVAKRRAEFATVRRCARVALAEMGIPSTALVPGAHGASRWPDGVVGSMTHCDGYRGAAVARAAQIVTIGIDVEPDQALPDGVLDLISVPADLTALPNSGAVSWDRLLFCAKEALYKAWFPLAGVFLNFDEAHVVIDRDGSFSAHLLRAGPEVNGEPIQTFAGRWVTDRGLLAAAVVVPENR